MSVQVVKNKLIGLTGGIASGKSTVSSYLQKKGFQVIDSDLIVHELWKTNESMKKKVISTFELNKDEDIIESLKTFVFKDKKALEQLNQIVHPFVFNAIDDKLKTMKDETIIFIDMPLLFEVGYQSEVDETWLVYVPQSIQIKRLMKRDHMSFVEAVERIGLQMDIEQKKMTADHILDNRKSMHHLHHQVDVLLKGYKHEK